MGRIKDNRVICYPKNNIKIKNWKKYKKARLSLKKIDEIIIPPRDAKCFSVKAGNFFQIESNLY